MKTRFLCLALLLCLLASCSQSPTLPKQCLRFGCSEPDSLDPRSARDLISASALNMLFEGLTRLDETGQVQPAAARSYEISPDGLTYTFRLRENFWSNGDPVTAHDFASAWLTLLNPSFPAPNAFQLFDIRHARTAKLGKRPLNEVGIQVPDAHTLVVTLEKPVAHFLNLTSFHAFFPVNQRVVEQHPKWAEGDFAFFVSNGPFQLKEWKPRNELQFVKNPYYWAKESIHLDEIRFIVIAEETALKLFEKGELDWVGSPLSTLPLDALSSLQAEGKLQTARATGTHWLRLNTADSSLQDVKLRQALALAIDRKSLVKHLIQGDALPATGIVPPSQTWQATTYFLDANSAKAQELFQEAVSGQDKPKLTLVYGNTERHHKLAQALQEQWHHVLGLEVSLEALEGKIFYDKLRSGQFTLANGSWFADFQDPINFLTVFKEKSNGTNNTGWENPTYQNLLEQALVEQNREKRTAMLREAEGLLIKEMPVIPLFYYSFNYMTNPKLQGVRLNELGILDVRKATIID